MAQFVTHIQPTLLEASQGHVPHHHGHQVGVQHSSHLPHSGHNMPSPPTAHNHHHHQHHHGSHPQGHQQAQSQSQHHPEQQHKKSQHPAGKSHAHQSPPSAVSSPPGEHVGHYDYFQHQHELAFQHANGATPGSNKQHHDKHDKHDKHEHCPTGHQSAVSLIADIMS
ncbi:hypothetical protein KR222_008818 [Zaprionus bogoriensis]|nr:hypothetical protein KR222_008818 [Zaprionus bogoriensis]